MQTTVATSTYLMKHQGSVLKSLYKKLGPLKVKVLIRLMNVAATSFQTISRLAVILQAQEDVRS